MEIKTPRSSVSAEGFVRGFQRLAGRRVEQREWIIAASVAALSFAFVAGHFIGLPSGFAKFGAGSFTMDPAEVVRVVRAPASMPRLEIDIKQKHYQQLEWKREQALARGLIITSEDSYVPARATIGGQSARVRMRLKGDYPDHLEGEKWSFRIKVKNGDTLLGMRRFSIQDPKRSGWIKEWILHRWLAYEGLIGLRYRFVDVTVNGEPKGVFALEESFGKELIEHNQRLDAPLLKFDEGLWIDLSRTNRGDRSGQADIFFAADILSFETEKTFEDPGRKSKFLTGRSLLAQLRRRELALSEVMDVPRAARVFAMQEILAVHHALRWKNVRFYFDPVARRLELIAYNAYGAGAALPAFVKLLHQQWREKDLGPYTVFEWIDVFFSDEQFQAHYWRELERLTAPGHVEAFFADIASELSTELAILYSDGAGAQPDVADYLRNRDAVRQILTPRLPIRVAFEGFDPTRRVLRLSILNRGYAPVSLHALTCAGEPNATPVAARVEGRTTGRPAEPQTIEIERVSASVRGCLERVVRTGDLEFFDGLELQYSLPGNTLPRTASTESSRWTPELTADPAQKANAASLADLVARGIVSVDDKAGVMRIQPGHWRLVRDAVFPEGTRVVGGPGTTLDLAHGAAVISFSPVFLRGTEDSPFSIESSDGTGEGLVVVSAPSESMLQHVRVTGQGALSRPGWTLTGAVTFYESDIRIEHSHFAESRSEDLVNISRSNFSIADSVFADSHSDALDIDFGDGSIVNSRFERCGNDCIDFSQSDTSIDHVEIVSAGDKGISVGEKSRVRLRDSVVDGAEIGIACKDSSELEISGVRISRSATGIAAYRKKSEFGGAVVHAAELEWTQVDTRITSDADSRVIVDDTHVVGSNWTRTP